MKKYFAYAFILSGLLVSAVSCAPLVRLTVNSASGEPFQTQSSFIAMAILLSFACLLTLIGVLMYTRHLPAANSSRANGESGNVIAQPSTSSRRRSMALNLSPLLILIAIPMAHLLVPLWVLKTARQRNPALAADARRLLNFEITWTLFAVVGLLLCVMLVGLLILAALLVFHLVVTLRAVYAISKGRTPHFPLSLTFLK